MKKGFLREKALLQIILLITAIIYFSYAIKPVEAASDVCCEKTISGQYCFYGDSSNCDPKYQYASTNCGQTSFCKTGCCYDLNEGFCYKSVPQAKCAGTENGEWYTDATCDSVGVCNPGCCVIGSQCSLTTEQSCALQTAKHPELEMIFHSSIEKEYECQDICRAVDKGCCVNTDSSCVYEIRESCDAAKGEFYNGQYCSDVAICGCTKHNSKTCYDDDVYWQDSCSNLEDVAEDCDYAKGTLCKRMEGEYKCGSVNCEKTYSDEKNVHDSNMGGFRKNGESWCIYESGTGDYLDRPGTRHYRHMCVNGQEVIEECRDYRDEICAQGQIEGMTEASCLHNDIYKSPIKEQISTVPRGFRFWEDKGDCSDGDTDCTVIWVKKNRMSSWKCEENCHCETQNYFDNMAKGCKTMGDCGADLNVMGERTTDGLVLAERSRDGPPSDEPSEQAWTDWSKYGVFGGMVDLFEKLLELIEDADSEDAQKIVDKYNQYSQYAMYGATVAATVATMAFAAEGGGFLGAFGSSWGALSGVSVLGVIMIVVIIILLIVMYLFGGGKVREYHVVIECKPWVAPTGGKNCEQCLDQKKVDELEYYGSCTEYKCKSLGLACQYIPENSGTERVACYWSSPNDVNSPIISPWEEALTKGFTIKSISQGYEIIPEVPYYQKISFGIKTNELAQCKIAQEHTKSYEEMTSFFGDSFYQMEHNITMNPQIGGQTYEYYVRCQDGNGNSNVAEYVIRFTTEDEPDKTAPIIEGTSIDDYGYVPAGTTEVGLAVYVNEPSECKWSLTDKKYGEMENAFYCQDEPTNALGYDTYACYTMLNLTSQGMNTYYFRCEDKSEFQNQNQQSYVFHLTNTMPLEIVSQSPEGILYTATSPTLEVVTSGGAESGAAKCYYSDDKTREVSLWPEFYETGTTVHSQPLLSLPQGEHNYYILCKDVAPNEANTTITFTIDKDTKPPEIEYIYMEPDVLHLILNEPSTCEYNNETFEYGEGYQMQGAETTHNTASTWENYYYINCGDKYKNHWSSPIIVYL